MRKINKPIAWMNEDGIVSSNEIEVEYWRIKGQKIIDLGVFVNIDEIHESLGAIRYGIKNEKPCIHIVNNLIDYLRKAITEADKAY